MTVFVWYLPGRDMWRDGPGKSAEYYNRVNPSIRICGCTRVPPRRTDLAREERELARNRQVRPWLWQWHHRVLVCVEVHGSSCCHTGNADYALVWRNHCRRGRCERQIRPMARYRTDSCWRVCPGHRLATHADWLEISDSYKK